MVNLLRNSTLQSPCLTIYWITNPSDQVKLIIRRGEFSKYKDKGVMNLVFKIHNITSFPPIGHNRTRRDEQKGSGGPDYATSEVSYYHTTPSQESGIRSGFRFMCGTPKYYTLSYSSAWTIMQRI